MCLCSSVNNRAAKQCKERGDPEMDAATIYANVMRTMKATSGARTSGRSCLLCASQSRTQTAKYYTEREHGLLYALASNIQGRLRGSGFNNHDCQEDARRENQQSATQRRISRITLEVRQGVPVAAAPAPVLPWVGSFAFSSLLFS
jgi:hypothetical protein